MYENVRWWLPGEVPEREREEYDHQRAAHLLQDTAAIEERQSSYHELNLWNATLYCNRELPGFRWGEVMADRELWPTNLRTENLIFSIGEAMVSKASSSPIKPTPVPRGCSLETERAVRLLDKFLMGVWMQTEAEDACIEMFRDAFMSGCGTVRVAYDEKRKSLHVDSVFFDNLIVDNRECANRAPPQTPRIRQVLPRTAVEKRYGVELHDQKRYVSYRDVAEGWVVVVEAWRFPDPDGSGGRHVVASCGKLLVDEPFTTYPLVHFHFTDRNSGWVVQSGVELLVPYQLIQNDLNDDIRLAQDLVCRPRLTLNANSMIDVSQWDNEAGRFLMWSGSKPEPFEWPSNLGELYNERERNKASAYSHMGMSEMFANADMPNQVRLDSSAGVREFRNMEDQRHLRLWTNFEKARKRVAKTIMAVLSNARGAKAFSAVYHPKGSKVGAQDIQWEAVRHLTDDEYSWTLEATPLSQLSPAARRELLRDFSSRQLIDVGSEEARRMEGHPNLERIEDLELASQDDILRHMSILEDGDFEAPTELTNCTLGIKMVTANYHRLKTYEDVKEPILQAHIEWIVKAVAIQQAAVAPAPPVPFAPTQGMPGTNAATAPPPPSQ